MTTNDKPVSYQVRFQFPEGSWSGWINSDTAAERDEHARMIGRKWGYALETRDLYDRPQPAAPQLSERQWHESIAHIAKQLRERGDDFSVSAASWLEKLAATPPAYPCVTCDDTGDIHRADGEYVGACPHGCTPPAAKPEQGEPVSHEQVAEFLHSVGWRSPLDAQWHNLRDAMPELMEKLRYSAQPKPEQGDDPDLDGTEFAHPAWWRGSDHAFFAMCRKVNAVLDGKDDGTGVSQEPWESTRRRLLALAAQPKPAGEAVDAEALAIIADKLEGVIQYGADTLSGPCQRVEDRALWDRDGIREMMKRAIDLRDFIARRLSGQEG